MTEDELVKMMRDYFEGLFPKVCENCGQRFETLREYILKTKRLGDPISYDAEEGNWKPSSPMGGVVMVNCSCGSTLALTTDSMSLSQIHVVLDWIKEECKRQRLNSSQLLNYIRDKVRTQVVGD